MTTQVAPSRMVAIPGRDGWTVTFKPDVKLRTLRELDSNDFDVKLTALARVIDTWHVLDVDTGAALGPPTLDTIQELPDSVVTAIVVAFNGYMAARTQLPNVNGSAP